jgi:serine/threonine protein kinase/Tol biopolymer transport system component
MPLIPGSRLGPYEIVAPLGAGGMGEVYRARDGTLNRDIAIKVLLPSVADDPDRLARFRREAQVLASLNHPNIAHIHGLEDFPIDGGRPLRALLMELVEGDDLAVLIARGRMPVDDALPIAKQIADALEAAHEQGIIHRDLKPANIKVRPDGTVKVLDFGLAKAMDLAAAASANAMNSPTLSIHATQAGIILGTAAYMSPEQARGRTVDKRTDIWALGCVLFEMLSGSRAFPGDDATDIIVAVVSKDPEWSALAAAVPAGIHRLLRRSLEKDPKRRLDSAAGVRIEIDEALSTPTLSTPSNPINRSRPALGLLPWGIAVAAVVAAGMFAWRAQDRQPGTPVYASLEAPADTVLGEDDFLASLPTRTPMVFTADGRSLIIQAARADKPQLFIRSLDRPDARPIAGTDDARVPFVSPDGKWVGFWAANELKKVPIEGGTATAICETRGPLGPLGVSWGAGDVIVFGDFSTGRLMRVSGNGGMVAPVTSLSQSGRARRHVSPFILPDGHRVLFTEIDIRDANNSRLMVQPLAGGDAREVLDSGNDGRLLAGGRLAFMRLGTLMTVGWSLDRAEVIGQPVAAMSGVMQSGIRGRFGAENTGAGMFAVSSLGALAAVRGGVTGPGEGPMVWVTPDGQSSSAEPASGAPAGGRQWTRISPDGTRAIVGVQTPVRSEMWLADWTRDVWSACIECPGVFGAAVWSPDGRRLLFPRNDSLVAITLDQSQPEQVLLLEDNRYLLPAVWLANGGIVYLSSPDENSYEIKLLESGAKAGRVIVPLGTGTEADVSVDGRWLAYRSGGTGAQSSSADNVIVEAFPGRGSRTQVSAGGGRNPAWSADGRTLYYLSITTPARPGSTVFAVEMKPEGAAIRAGTPRELFRRPDGQGCVGIRCYDILRDGPRFLFRERSLATRQSVNRMDLVLNWTATLPGNR